MKGYVLILGGSSGIARAYAEEALKAGYGVILGGRDESILQKIKNDLKIRAKSSDIKTFNFDALNLEEFSKNLESFSKERCALVGSLVAFGVMYDQEKTQADYSKLVETFSINLVQTALVLENLAAFFCLQKSGFIACISSVAGDLGRQSNYIYGASKAGLSAYLQGLRNRLYHYGIHVLTIKPGPVRTKMTAGMENLPLLVDSSLVGRQIHRAIMKKTNILYTPKKWVLVMSLLKSIPEFIFKRLKL